MIKIKYDLKGKKFGRLRVVCLDEERILKEKQEVINGIRKCSSIYWICKCDCGNIISVRSCRIKNGKTKSCGCYKIEKLIQYTKNNKTKQNKYEEFDSYYKGWDETCENFFLISKEDYNVVKNFYWYRKKDNNEYSTWVSHDKETGKLIKLYQLIIKQAKIKYDTKNGDVVDHISNKLTYEKTDDNRRENLRIVTTSINGRNKKTPSNNISGKQGVGWNKNSGKWRARIVNNEGKTICKSFHTFEEALEQRIKWEKEFGYIGE